MAVTAAMVKELREMTGAGMMDCKKALTATEGDMDAAVEFLRKNGQAKAEKKAGRIAAEGLCRVAVKDEGTAAVVEVNSETDFVAKNEKFQNRAQPPMPRSSGWRRTKRAPSVSCARIAGRVITTSPMWSRRMTKIRWTEARSSGLAFLRLRDGGG